MKFGDEKQMAVFDSVVAEFGLEKHKAQLFVLLSSVFAGERSSDDLFVDIDALLEVEGLDQEKLLDIELVFFSKLIEPYDDQLEAAFQQNKIPFLTFVEKLKKDQSLRFENDRLNRRFAHLCEVYFKGEYAFDRAKRTLVKSVKAGGLGLEASVGDAIMEVLVAGEDRVTFDVPVQKKAAVPVAPRVNAPVAPRAVKKVVPRAVLRSKAALPPKKEVAVPASPKKIVPRAVPVKKVVVKPAVVKKVVPRAVAKQKVPVAKVAPVARVPAVKRMSPVAVKRASSAVTVQANMDTAKGVAKLHTTGVLVADEHKEVVTAQKQVEKHASGADSQVELHQKVRDTIAQSGLKYKDEKLNKQFHSIIISRLKETRGPYETRDAVMRSQEKGGLGMDVDVAQKFLRILEIANDELHATWSAREREKKIEYLRERRAQLFTKKVAGKKKVAHRGTSADVRKVLKKVPVAKRQPLVSDNLKTTKPAMHDVKAPPNLTNPVSELKSYTLEDFHRLHKDAKEAALKIEGKIRLLGQESFVHMKKGEAAWKQSEVMTIYKEQLQQSIVGNLPLSEVIVKRKANDLLVLEENEVAALTDLSTRLRS